MKNEEIGDYTCDKCDFKWKNKNNFTYHMKSIHKTEVTEGLNENLEKIQTLEKQVTEKE